MASITKAATADVDMTMLLHARQIPDLVAGEDIPVCSPVYIKASDGKVYRANGTAATEPATVHGFVARNVKTNQAITVFKSMRVLWAATGLTPGSKVFLGASAGGLDTAATTGGTAPIGHAINATDLYLGVA